MSRVVLVLMVVVLSCLASGIAVAAELSTPDRRAREQAQEILERARTPEHRKRLRIVVPEEPSRLPARYTLRHHSNFIAFVEYSHTIEIERDARGARVELLEPEGIRRASLPAAEVDAFVRLAFYLTRARTEEEDAFPFGGGSFATHVPDQQIRIEGEGLSITTIYAQAIVDEVEWEVLDHFVLSELARRLAAMVAAHVTEAHVVPLDAATIAEVQRRLRAIPRGATSLSQYDREDRDAVVARLLAEQLVRGRVASAVPLLQRKELDRQAYLLSLHTTPPADLPHALPGLLCSDVFELHHPAIAVAGEHREQSRAALLYALGCTMPEDRVQQLLRELARAPRGESESLRPVRRLLSDGRSPALRVAAARTLWMLERDPGAERLLRSLALGDGRSSRLEDVALDALMAFAAGIERKGAERHLVAELAREMLRGVPMDRSSERLSVAVVMEKLWQYGEPQEADALVPWLDHPDAGLASDALEFIDRLDSVRALAEARERVRRYARGAGQADYAHTVGVVAQTLARHEDRAVLEDLRAAAVPLRAEAPASSDPRRRAHAALVGYLEAAPAKKARALLRWVEVTPELERLTFEALRGRHGLDEAALDRAQEVAQAGADDQG